MYRLNDKFVNISAYDVYLAHKYITKNQNIVDFDQISKRIELYMRDLNVSNKKSIQINQNDPIVDYILKMYQSELDLQMIQNSIMWSMVNIKNTEKFELEYLYKTVMAQKLKAGASWTHEKENNLIVELLKNINGLYDYIIYTQSMDIYTENAELKLGLQKKLERHLNR